MKRRIRTVSSGVLRAMDSWLDGLPSIVLRDLRFAIKDELLARDLAAIADDLGGYTCAPIRGVQ